jgi:hypothetical protein
MALPHVAVRGNPPCGTKRCSLGEFLAHFRDRAGDLESAAERIGAAGLECFQFFAALRYETIFVVHLGRSNLERHFEMNSAKVTAASALNELALSRKISAIWS